MLELQQELEALDPPANGVKRRRTSQGTGLDGVPSEMDLDDVTIARDQQRLSVVEAVDCGRGE